MSDRYHGSAYRSRGASYRDDRRYPPRHHPRDDHEYPDSRPAYDARDSYAASSYYPEPRYPERPHGRRVHKTIPPPRPWDYSRRPPPRNEQERMELEREREAWEAKEEERYKQRMEERERERQRDWERNGYGAYGPPGGRERDREVDVYDRERAARQSDLGPARRPRSRSPPGADPRYEQRGSWGRASVGSSEGRERELVGVPASASAERLDAAGGYPPRRSPPPPASSSEAAAAGAAVRTEAAAPTSYPDASDAPSASRYRPSSPPRGPARDSSGFISTPPTGPRASRGGPPPHPSSAFRGREGSGSAGTYTPGLERDREASSSYMSPSNGRFGRAGGREGGPPQGGAYRGGHPSFGRGRRDTNPYDSGYYAAEDEAGYRGGYGGGAGSSPHENSPYSPSTSTPAGGLHHSHHHLTAPRLSRTSSSQTSGTPAAIPTGPASALASPSTLAPPSSATATATPHFSAAHVLTPELDAELLALETQRAAFVSSHLLGAKRASVRALRTELREAELDYATAGNRRHAAERALEVARETADAYSLEENRKDELQRLIAQQLVQSM
ncbi:hypothetical protein EX895_000361 [Sporisorium graminicola]|uniref:Uncharacterized protein n=1 Tax=Sporisorium graminicola TaxID=280036 RepID=A0A4U7KZV3_9BASI|nr:hypothetical protein EX895_000361 [Sporisorium graminicola]TKY90363.1 hypothetical protein EX895_000361 [Sporisorium graminicola]